MYQHARRSGGFVFPLSSCVVTTRNQNSVSHAIFWIWLHVILPERRSPPSPSVYDASAFSVVISILPIQLYVDRSMLS